MLDAQREAFGGVRPMVNMNQLGEAAGTAAYLALSKDTPIPKVDARQVRKLLAKGGSIIIWGSFKICSLGAAMHEGYML